MTEMKKKNQYILFKLMLGRLLLIKKSPNLIA